MATNTNYDWANVSDQYLDEIIALNLSVSKRFTKRHQWAKFERAMDNIKAAQQERENRRQRNA
jgi:hypothetical protein